MRFPSITFALVALLGVAAPTLHAQTLSANAGMDQHDMFVGDTVNLNGSGSIGATSYAWTITKKPSGSAVMLLNPTTATPSVVPDRGGQYTVKLTVGNGVTTASDTVLIITGNRAPTANAGPDVASTVGKTVTLDGTGSTDPDLNKLTYAWTLISRPDASVSPLTKPTASKASLLLDRPGTYVVQLVVKDGVLFSAPDQVTISTANMAPVADAGADRQIAVGALVQLNGTGSSDLDGNPITYAWTLKRPGGSTAVLTDPASPMPAFTADKAGNYTATLNVSDGTLTVKDSAVITTGNNRNPVARTKADDVALAPGQTIQLDGGDSTDANGGLLAYSWTITKRPAASTAALVGPSTPRPTFTADKAGSYTFSLLVTDPGTLTHTDTQIDGTPLPQADAGADQTAAVGIPVTLDGSRSSHLGANAAITYGWALISMPAGSLAELDDPTDPQPTFTPDLPGMYVAQLVLFDGAKLGKADTATVSTNGNLPASVNLGDDRRVTTGALVTVDAVATDPDMDPLTFAWALLSRPAGSAATLSAAAGTPVHLTPDVAGDYIVQLTATDPGSLAGVDTLLITTGNTTPIVIAPADGGAASGVAVPLSAAASDPDGGAITYRWSLLSKPSGSGAAISSPSAPSPTFTPDADGVYVVQVIVRDNRNLYATDAAVFRVGGTGNPPIADAGSPQTVAPGAVVHLDGSGSSDPESQPLTYAWQIVSKPAGSSAALNNVSIVNPQFAADLAGDYVVRLVVNDGSQNSLPSEVTITANAAPTANAGPDQNGVDVGVVVNLTGAASTDPESQPLTYAWSFTSKPAGSGATLTGPTSATPSFTPDVGGTYVVQLIVNDGTTASTPDAVTVITRHLLTLSPGGLSLSVGGSGLLTVTAAHASPAPLLLTLQSSNTAVATVPANVTIPANQLSASFTVTGGASSGGVLISATGADGAKGSATVAVGTRLVQWNVDANGAWETASNWTDNTIPGAGDVVVIDRPAGNFVVTLSSGTPALASLLSRETLTVNGTLTVDGAVAFEGPVTLTGTLNGTAAATLNSAMTWSSGNVMMGGGLTVLPGRTLIFPSNNVGRTLVGSSILNHGTVNMGTTNALTLQSPASVTNAADGLWTVGTGVITSNGGGTLAVANAGTWRKTGNGLLQLAGLIPYTNTGTLDFQDGIAQIDGTLLTSGVISLGPATIFNLNNVTLTATTTFAGSGTLAMNGTTTVTGSVTITLPVTLTNTLTGSGAVHMAAPFTWTSGNITNAGGLEVLSGRTLTFPSNNVGRTLVGSSILNHGTVNMGTTNALTLQSPASVTNAADGLWTVGTGVITSNGGGTLAVANAGTWRKTGNGLLQLAGLIPYTNTGTLDFQDGIAQIDGTLLTSGVISLGPATIFNLNNVTLTATTTFAGSGTLAMNGTTTVTGSVTITLPVTLTNTLTGSGAVHMAAPFTWTSGNITNAGGLEVLSGRTLTFPSNNVGRTLVGSSILNHGTVNMGTTNALTLQSPASVTNAADGLWTVGTGVITSNGGGTLAVANAGTWRKTGSGLLQLAGLIPYTNTGTLDFQDGIAQIDGTLLTSGVISLGPATIFNLNNVTLTATTTFAGSGTLAMNGTTTVTGSVTITLPVNLANTLTGSGAVHMAAPFTWTSGNITNAGGLEVLSGRTLTFPSNNVGRTLVGSSILNHGTVNMGTTNALTLQSPASVTNAADGLWTVGTGVITSNGGGTLAVANAGTWRKTGNGLLQLAGLIPYTNTGTLDFQDGVVQVDATLVSSGALSVGAGAVMNMNGVTLNAGSTVAGPGTLNMNGTTTLNAVLTSTAPVTLSSTLTGTGTLKMAAPMTWTGGVLSLDGGIEILAGRSLALSGGIALVTSTGTSVKNFGTVNWTSPGSFTYQGGSIAIRNEVGGVWNLTAGNFSLAGNGSPNPLGSFTFLNAGTVQGAGSPATTLNVASNVSFSNTGSVSNMLVAP